MGQLNSCRWRVLAASVQGASHQRIGQPCQDANAWQQPRKGSLIAAIADGAGSSIFGHIGARTAVRNAVRWLSAHFLLISSMDRMQVSEQKTRDLLLSALQAARKALEQETFSKSCSLNDLATTLIVLWATSETVAVAQVGDGAAVLRDCKGNLLSLTTPQSGEYANETVFLTSSNFHQAVQFAFCHATVSHIALFSDGLQMLALQMPGGQPYSPFFEPLFLFISGEHKSGEMVHQLRTFLQSPRVQERTADDLTLLLAVLR